MVPKRRHPRARAVLISTEEILNGKESGEIVSKFLEAERHPSEAEVRLMFSLALKELVRVCMNSHTYSIAGQMVDCSPNWLEVIWHSRQGVYVELV